MSRKTYPHLEYDRPLKGQKLCDCCQGIAVRKVEFQTNYFRGDDEVLKLCLVHHPIVKESGGLDVLLRLQETERARRRAITLKPVAKFAETTHETHPRPTERSEVPQHAAVVRVP